MSGESAYLLEHHDRIERAVTDAINAAVSERASDPLCRIAQHIVQHAAEKVEAEGARAVDEAYLIEHHECIERAVAHAIDAVVSERAAEPLQRVAQYLYEFSQAERELQAATEIVQIVEALDRTLEHARKCGVDRGLIKAGEQRLHELRSTAGPSSTNEEVAAKHPLNRALAVSGVCVRYTLALICLSSGARLDEVVAVEQVLAELRDASPAPRSQEESGGSRPAEDASCARRSGDVGGVRSMGGRSRKPSR